THRHAHAVLFSDTHLQKPVRVRFGELVRFGRVGQIGIQYDNVWVCFAQRHQRITPYVTHSLPTNASSMPSSSAMIFNSSLVATLECHSCLPSVKCTPLPLTVRATIMVG